MIPKRKRAWRYGCLAAALTACLLAGGYFAMRRYYENADFICGTWINGIYCAGKHIGEVDAELLQTLPAPSLVVTDRDGAAQTLLPALFDPEAVRYSFRAPLARISGSREPGGWLSDTFHSVRYEIEPEVTVSREACDRAAESLACLNAAARRAPQVRIARTADGYALIDEKAHVLNPEKVKRAVYQAFADRQATLDLQRAGCYETAAYTPQDRETLALWRKVEAFQDCGIVYRICGEEVPVDAAVVSGWIRLAEDGGFLLDEAGELVLDEGQVAAFVASLAARYDTCGAARAFRATRGETVRIEGGTYGTRIDQKAETAYLTEAFLAGVREVREPIYAQRTLLQEKAAESGALSQEKAAAAGSASPAEGTAPAGGRQEGGLSGVSQSGALSQEKAAAAGGALPAEGTAPAGGAQDGGVLGWDDIGDTYIEVDIGSQMLYYYEDGRRLIETPIVTGDLMRRRKTPSAVCFVYAKQKNRVLRGSGYASRVRYWMPVQGGIGIHDASWRREFGGEIYKTDGSHGCINTPLEAVEQLYERVEIGTPVVMFE